MTTIHATTYFDGDHTRGFGVALTICDAAGTTSALDWIPTEGVSILDPIDWTADDAAELLRQHGWTLVGIWDEITDPHDDATGARCMVQRAAAEPKGEVMSRQHNASAGGTVLSTAVETDLARRCAIANVGPQMWADMTRWERSNEIAVALHLVRLGLASIQADVTARPRKGRSAA